MFLLISINLQVSYIYCQFYLDHIILLRIKILYIQVMERMWLMVSMLACKLALFYMPDFMFFYGVDLYFASPNYE